MRSSHTDAQCVEVARPAGIVGIADSKVGHDYVVTATSNAWAAFLDVVKKNQE